MTDIRCPSCGTVFATPAAQPPPAPAHAAELVAPIPVADLEDVPVSIPGPQQSLPRKRRVITAPKKRKAESKATRALKAFARMAKAKAKKR